MTTFSEDDPFAKSVDRFMTPTHNTREEETCQCTHFSKDIIDTSECKLHQGNPNTREVEEWEVIKTDIHSPFLVMLHSTLINSSIYKTSGEMAQAVIKVFEEYAVPSLVAHQLQKAREEERERLFENPLELFRGNRIKMTIEAREALLMSIDVIPDHSELDQDNSNNS